MEKLTLKEEEVMEKIWAIDAPCAPKDVVALYDEPKPNVNTVATSFQSLEKKGYLSHKSCGRGYLYYAIIEKTAYGSNRFGGLVERFFGGSLLSAVSAFVKEDNVDADELIEYLQNLKNKRR